MSTWPELIAAFLGGGAVAGLIGAWSTSRRERTARQVEFLGRQLQDLYGPLQFLTTATAALFTHSDALAKAYTREYVDGAADATAAATQTIGPPKESARDVLDTYVTVAMKNTDSAVELLERNYALVDPRDAEVFGAFLADVMQRRAQTDEEGVSRLPHVLTFQLGGSLAMSPEFIEAVDSRFNEKRRELGVLEGRSGS